MITQNTEYESVSLRQFGTREWRHQFDWTLMLVLCILGIHIQGTEQKITDERFPWLHTFNVGDWPTTFKTNKQVVQTGKPLRRIAYGLHSLEEGQESNPTVLIAIHGFKARGYEWVYPLSIMDDDSIHTHYFRWDFLEKNTKARRIFLADLSEVMERRTAPLERIIIVGHSCGGVMVASAIADFPENVQIDVHTVASPLNGLGLFTVCRPKLPKSLPENVSLTQWRTSKVQDSVFWWFPRDPQRISKDFGATIALPKKYHGIRLGHVRSLSWVAERIFEEKPLNENSSPERLVETEDSDSPSTPVSD